MRAVVVSRPENFNHHTEEFIKDIQSCQLFRVIRPGATDSSDPGFFYWYPTKIHLITFKLFVMLNQTIETTLARLKKDLQDVNIRDAQTGFVYLAYKEHTLSSGIYTLQNLATAGRSKYSEGICDLLAEYHQLYRTIFIQD